MRLVHFVEQGEVIGGLERYLQLLLADSPGLEHAVIMESATRCEYSGDWPVHLARWTTRISWDEEAAARIGSLGRELDGFAIFHSVPEPRVLQAWLGLGRPAAVMCHDVRWWCPSASRFHARRARACQITAGAVSCTMRYHALGCGGLRVGPMIEGLRRASAGRGAMARAHVVLVASSYMRREAARHGAREARIRLIHLPSSFAGIGPLPESPPPPIVLFASRLTLLKGVGVLLEAFAHMKQEAGLVIAGTGIADRQIAAAVQAHPRRDRIHLAGHLQASALRDAMERAAVVVVPSMLPEAFGLVGIEALALGRPVVATDVGGVGDWARSELGALCIPRADPFVLAEALDRVVADPSWGSRARERGATWVAQRHSLAAHVAELKSILATVTP
jgi:glycosyltransferase involved in cell wall biosynthesis